VRIQLSIFGETFSYELDDEEQEMERMNFGRAISGFEHILRAAYPTFEGHGLVSLCPDGNIHEDESSGDDEGKSVGEDGGIDLGKKG
jgi:hypothetical protein